MTAEQLRNQFESDLKNLQDHCPHDKSEWMLDSWAPGHFHGEVKVCLNCEKVMERNKG